MKERLKEYGGREWVRWMFDKYKRSAYKSSRRLGMKEMLNSGGTCWIYSANRKCRWMWPAQWLEKRQEWRYLAIMQTERSIEGVIVTEIIKEKSRERKKVKGKNTAFLLVPHSYSPFSQYLFNFVLLTCFLSSQVLSIFPRSGPASLFSGRMPSLSRSFVVFHTCTWVCSLTVPLPCDHSSKHFDLEPLS